MIEPTESENLEEIDKFCDSLISIRMEIESLNYHDEKSVLKNSPHTLDELCSDNWGHCYSRQKAAFPLDFVKKNKTLTFMEFFFVTLAKKNKMKIDINIILIKVLIWESDVKIDLLPFKNLMYTINGTLPKIINTIAVVSIAKLLKKPMDWL